MELILTIFILIVAAGVLYTLIRRDHKVTLNTKPYDRELPTNTPGKQE
jgi:hypothetical protein